MISLAALWNPKAKLWISGRKASVAPLDQRPVWMHCASLGEFEQGRPVIELLKKRFPEIKVLLTFFSPSGYEVRKNYAGADLVCYLPIDTPERVRNFIETQRPLIAIFVKYEIWHNLIEALHKKEIPAYLIAARFRKEQIYFKWWGAWFAASLRKYTQIFVQDHQSKSLLSALNIDSLVTGDTRFDRVIEVAQNWQASDVADVFANNSRLLVAGSTWPEDENMLSEYLEKNGAKYPLKIILAPHEVGPQKISAVKRRFKNVALFSDDSEIKKNAQVLIIDTIGLLNRLYKYGEICYIGGGFGAGIHNTLEAAVYGKPLIFGPEYHKFKEAKELIDCGAAISYTHYQQLEGALNNFLSNQTVIGIAGNAAEKMIYANSGATAAIVKTISTKL